MPLTRRELLGASAAGLLAPLAACGGARAPESDPARMNLLFVVLEDTSASSLGCYGNPIAKTPSIDALAESGLRFERAYCQATVCNPSRASILTGLRPSTTGVLYNGDRLELPGGVQALPRLLEPAGAKRYAIGKIFHSPETAGAHLAGFETLAYQEPGEGEARARELRVSGDPELEAELLRREAAAERAERRSPGAPEAREARRQFRQLLADVVGDSGLGEDEETDGRIRRRAVELLGELARTRERFFLALGFSRPHVPLRCPREYLELYDPAAMPLPEAPAERDRGIPEVARRFGGNLDIFRALEPTPQRVREVLRAYYACLSFADAQVGRVLAALEATGLAGNTIVILFADHGFHLGQHGIWSKRTLFEQSTRVPLLIRVPGGAGSGRVCRESFVELADLAPTLCDWWRAPATQAFEGRSLRALCEDPTREHRRAARSECTIDAVLGRSLRTGRYRYSEWRGHRRDGSALHEIELYDLALDPQEQENRAASPEYQAARARLASWLARSGGFSRRFTG